MLFIINSQKGHKSEQLVPLVEEQQQQQSAAAVQQVYWMCLQLY